ncbi:UNVERIFIED_CONTAM: hypothetical protein FKN15_006284 [Acipenser sinensis]
MQSLVRSIYSAFKVYKTKNKANLHLERIINVILRAVLKAWRSNNHHLPALSVQIHQVNKPGHIVIQCSLEAPVSDAVSRCSNSSV